MKKMILFIILAAFSFMSCSYYNMNDFADDFADNATAIAETIADNPVVETVSYAYTEKLVSSTKAALKAEIDPIGYCKDKIEQTKDDIHDIVKEVF